MSSTLALFAVAIGGVLYVRGELGSVRDLVDRSAEDRAEAHAAGPTFVQKEAVRQQVARDDELDELGDFGPPLGGGDGDDRVAEGATDTGDGRDEVKPVRTAIEDVCVDGTEERCKRWAMDGFYDALAASGAQVARISLWGDSVTAEGYIADGMRARLVKQHGDGGTGFVFLAKPSRWYQNTAVRQSQSKGWQVESIIHNANPDRLHGLGGASFTGTRGDSVTFQTAKKGAGSKASRFELYYLANPKGGTAEIRVDGKLEATVDTRADKTASGFATVTMSDGAHKVEVKVTEGKVRAYGVTLERDAGVAVDSLGLVSNTAKNLAEIKGAHWEEQLAHRSADLMMILLGANESAWLGSKASLKEFQDAWEKVLARVRRGNPDGACVVLGTLDAGAMVDGKYVGRGAIDGMIKAERAAARKHGCAFWDARAYMGGKGSAKAWRKKGLMSGDFEHLTKKGGQVLGGGIVEAVEAGYAARGQR
jgi:lysophospholipase L1-like esterase